MARLSVTRASANGDEVNFDIVGEDADEVATILHEVDATVLNPVSDDAAVQLLQAVFGQGTTVVEVTDLIPPPAEEPPVPDPLTTAQQFDPADDEPAYYGDGFGYPVGFAYPFAH